MNDMRIRLFIVCFLLIYPLAFAKKKVERTLNFNDNWLFQKDDFRGAEQNVFNDVNFRKIELPHDWSIEDLPNQSETVTGTFDKNSLAKKTTGFTIGGDGWYRKKFRTTNEMKGKIVK